MGQSPALTTILWVHLTYHLCCFLSFTGTSIIQVTARDADDPTYGNSARLVYAITQGQDYFSVDPQTGLFTASLVPHILSKLCLSSWWSHFIQLIPVVRFEIIWCVLATICPTWRRTFILTHILYDLFRNRSGLESYVFQCPNSKMYASDSLWW